MTQSDVSATIHGTGPRLYYLSDDGTLCRIDESIVGLKRRDAYLCAGLLDLVAELMEDEGVNIE